MTGRGRLPRGNVGSSGSKAPPRSARLASASVSGVSKVGSLGTTRSSSGSPSSRTRSLTPSSTPSSTSSSPARGGKTRGGMRGRPHLPAAAAAAQGNVRALRPSPASSPLRSGGPPSVPTSAKRRSSLEERKQQRKSRRPKFQDNPPAPEIVEKRALKSASVTPEAASSSPNNTTSRDEDDGEEEEEEEEEEENTEPGDVGCEETNNIMKDSNGHAGDGMDSEEGEDSMANGDHNNGPSSDAVGPKKRPFSEANKSEDETSPTKHKRPKLASISETVSNLVDDIVLQIDKEPISEGGDDAKKTPTEDITITSSACSESELNDNMASVDKEDIAAKMKQLVDAKLGGKSASTAISDKEVVSGEENKLSELLVKALSDNLSKAVSNDKPSGGDSVGGDSKLTKLKQCLCNLIKASVAMYSSDKSQSKLTGEELEALKINVRAVLKSALVNSDMSSYAQLMQEVESSSPLQGARDALIKELVAFLSEELAKEGLLSSQIDDEEELNIKGEDNDALREGGEDGAATDDLKNVDSLVPELVPQVDGVDSSAEGKLTSDEAMSKKSEAVQNKLEPSDKREEDSEDEEDEDMEEDEIDDDEDNSKKVSFKTKGDKSKLLSQMEDKFAKETHNALKNKPVYKKRKPMSEEGEQLVHNGKEKTDADPENSDAKIILMKEPGEVEVMASVPNTSDADIPKVDVVDDSANSPSKVSCKDLPPPHLDHYEADMGPMLPSAKESLVDSSSHPVTSPTSSSALIKSLRKVRVRRSRNSSVQDGQDCVSPSTSFGTVPSITTTDTSINPDDGPPNITKGSGNVTRPRIMSPPPLLTPEVEPSSPSLPKMGSGSMSMPPLRIEIPDNHHHDGQRRHSSGHHHLNTPIRTSPASSLSGRRIEVSPTILSKVDAEVAAAAVQISPSLVFTTPATEKLNGAPTDKVEMHTSLKTVIRLPKMGASSGQSSSSSSSKKANKKKNLVPPITAVNFTVESDGGMDTEEDDHLQVPERRRRAKGATSGDEGRMMFDDKTSADEETDGGGKQSPDSQKSSDEKAAESMVVPEKASSFNIHPERTCSDCCYYCGQKFGMLDTPLHISQMKSMEIQKFAIECTNFSRDACLCDKCYRFLDRKAKNRNKPGNKSGGNDSETGSGREERVRACFVRNCNREVTSTVSKKWLHRLKKKLAKKLAMDWDRVSKASMKTSFPVCNKHSGVIDYYSQCGLCKRKLNIGGICSLGMTKIEVQELNALLGADNIPAGLVENMFVCKLCKTFCGIKQKAVAPDYLKNHKPHKLFYKDYKRRLYVMLGLEDGIAEEHRSPDSSAQKAQKKIHQVSSQSDNPTKITIKTTTLEVPTLHDRPSRKRRTKEFASPTSESRIQVVSHDSVEGSNQPRGRSEGTKGHSPSTGGAANGSSSGSNSASGGGNGSGTNPIDNALEMCSVTIQFDLNTKKLWQDLHFPYGNYTSFFRHLILLEKYWRSGDLTLSESASQKASVYIKSVHNRIEAYEGKHKRSEADLSASTRPDLSVPSAPMMLHVPAPLVIEAATTRRRTSGEDSPVPPPPLNRKEIGDGSTILKIPKVSMPKGADGSEMGPSGAPMSPPSLPTKIRVRNDLMHLGLVAKSSAEPNIMEAEQHKASQQLSVLASKAAAASNDYSRSAQPHLMQLLNDPPLKKHKSSNLGPTLGKTSLVASRPSTSAAQQKSSNSQLFKNADSTGSSAIPLTFNNSIAEVLAAASKANKTKEMANTLAGMSSSKPEVTITAKSMGGSKSPITSLSDARAMSKSMWPEDKLTSSTGKSCSSVFSVATKTSTMLNSASPSGGLSIQKSSSKSSPIVTSKPLPVTNPNPLIDMSKLLQSQAPGVAPHIVAQNTLTIPTSTTGGISSSSSKQQVSTHQLAGTMPKIAPKPPSSSSLVRPLPVNKSSGITTVNKKSLNTVLDRLSGLKTSTVTSSSASSLVQQLQAPPIMANPSMTSPPTGSTSKSQQQQQQARVSTSARSSHTNNQQLQQNLQNLTSASSLLGMGFPGASPASGSGLVGQPMVQYPWASAAANQAAQAQQAAQVAQATLLMAGAGLPGMNQAAAAAAMQELMKISLQAQAANSPQAPRIRAPPPLTHMGRPGGAHGSSSQQQKQQHKKD